MNPNNQLALLADKIHRIKSLWEINIIVTEVETCKVLLRVRALVVENLHVECFGGQTFHLDNGIVDDVSSGKISLHKGKFQIHQDNRFSNLEAYPPPYLTVDDQQQDSSIQLQSLRPSSCGNLSAANVISTVEGLSDKNLESKPDNSIKMGKYCDLNEQIETISLKKEKFLLPGDTYSIPLIQTCETDNIIIVPQPPLIPDANAFENSSWPPQLCAVQDGKALYVNNSDRLPLHHPHHVHFRAVKVLDIKPAHIVHTVGGSVSKSKPCLDRTDVAKVMGEIKINHEAMTPAQRRRLDQIHNENIGVFNEDMTDGYNNAEYPYEATFSFRQENKAPPYKLWAPQFNRKCQDLLQAKCDQLERQGVLTDPKHHGIDIRHASPCFIQQKARARHKPLDKCDLSEIRFITSFNVLNDSIHPMQGRSNTYNDIVKFLGRFKHFIFADLLNSYFQVKVDKRFWKYLAIMTPHRGMKVLTRCGQGLLNSDFHLDEVMADTLGDDISKGYACVARDDLFIGGNTIDEALENYASIMSKLNKNNLKLTARKVRIFLPDTEVFGHRITNNKVSPSDHIITTLAKTSMDELITIKQVNSWRGLYKTLIRHLPNLAQFMAPFDAACGGKSSVSNFDWTKPGMAEAFNAAINQLGKVHATVLPNPAEQLYLLPDTSKSNLCSGWVLYTKRDEKLLPVQYASAKLSKYMETWCPCELEGVGTVLAIDQVRHWINESEKSTSQ